MLDKTTVLVCVVLGATLSTARAETEPEADPGTAPHAAATADGGNDQLTLPKGRLLLDALVEINLSSGLAFKPFSITPDLWYGVTDEVTVGLVHSGLGRTGFMGEVGDSLCLSGSSGQCGDVYHNVGADVRYKLKNGPLAYAADGGLYASSISPFVLAVKLGVSGRWSRGKLAVEAQPNVFIGVTNRTTTIAGPTPGTTVDVTSNGETLNLPATAFYTVAPKIAVSAQIGFVIPFEDTGNTYRIPLSIGGNYSLDESLNFTLAFTLPRLVAGSGGGADARSLTLGGTYAF